MKSRRSRSLSPAKAAKGLSPAKAPFACKVRSEEKTSSKATHFTRAFGTTTRSREVSNTTSGLVSVWAVATWVPLGTSMQEGPSGAGTKVSSVDAHLGARSSTPAASRKARKFLSGTLSSRSKTRSISLAKSRVMARPGPPGRPFHPHTSPSLGSRKPVRTSSLPAKRRGPSGVLSLILSPGAFLLMPPPRAPGKRDRPG